MKNKKKKFQVPHVYVILFGLIALFSILSYIIPAGAYNMVELPGGGEVIQDGTFHFVESTPIGLMNFLSAIPKGMGESAQIIFFIFICGGSMAVLQETKAIEAGMGILAKKLKGASIVIVPIVMFCFSLCGSVFGMAEETIPFVAIFGSLCMAMGYDSLTGAALVLCGAGAGFAGAFINPFTVQVAQGIAGLPPLSGMGFRIIMYVAFVGISVGYVMIYANKIKKNPEKSLVYDIDKARTDKVDLEDLPEFGAREKIVLLVFLASMILLIVGVINWGWYMNEIAALFLGMSIVVAVITRMGLNHYAEVIGEGMAAVTTGALIVGLARGILVVMTEGQILHTILFASANLLGKLPSSVAAVGTYIFQCFLNFMVPSGSGQAAVSIPILAPLGDLVGVTRQATCIAFQLGDGISNIILPYGYAIAGLSLGKIPWEKWMKWVIPLIGLQYLAGAIFVIIAQVIQLGPM